MLERLSYPDNPDSDWDSLIESYKKRKKKKTCDVIVMYNYAMLMTILKKIYNINIKNQVTHFN